MTARILIIAAALIAGTSAAAEPPKAQESDQNRPGKAPAELVLASADQARPSAPVADQQNPAPVKHRTARVTSCRCGDPQNAEPDDE